MTQRWLIGVLLAIGLLWSGGAWAQATGTYTCPLSITVTSGSTTSVTASPGGCTGFEPYTYGTAAATAPYSNSYYIPIIPNTSPGSMAHIPAGNIVDLPSAQTITGLKTFNGGLTAVTPLTITGLVVNSSLAGGAYPAITGLGTVTSGTWNGTIVGLAYGGTNANLSATGGSNQVLQQSSNGAAITVGQLSAGSLSNGTTGSGAIVLASGPTIGASTFNSTISATGLPTSGTIANSICQTSTGALLSIAGSCFTTSGVSSVAGTAGQIIPSSPQIGAVTLSLPATLTPNETASGEWLFTGGIGVPPVTGTCGATVTPTLATQSNECTISSSGVTLNVMSPFTAGITFYETFQEPSGQTYPISVASNITLPGGAAATLAKPTAGDRYRLVCTSTVIGGTNSMDCGHLDQLRQPPAWHTGCNASSVSTLSTISCSFTGGYTPPVGSTVVVGFDAFTGTSTNLFGTATFSGGTCVQPPNSFIYNATFVTGYYSLTCQVTTAGATSLAINFSSSVSGGDMAVDVIANGYGVDSSAINTTTTATSTPTSGNGTTSNQDMVWGWLRCGACGTVTAGTGFTLGQNVAGDMQTEYGLFPQSSGGVAANFNASTAAGYGAAAVMILP